MTKNPSFMIYPYRNRWLIVAQVLSVLAWMLSWVWFATFSISLLTMLLYQSLWFRRQKQCNLIFYAVLAILAGGTSIYNGIYVQNNWKNSNSCTPFFRVTNANPFLEAGNCHETFFASISFACAGLWLAASTCIITFVVSGAHSKLEAKFCVDSTDSDSDGGSDGDSNINIKSNNNGTASPDIEQPGDSVSKGRASSTSCWLFNCCDSAKSREGSDRQFSGPDTATLKAKTPYRHRERKFETLPDSGPDVAILKPKSIPDVSLERELKPPLPVAKSTPYLACERKFEKMPDSGPDAAILKPKSTPSVNRERELKPPLPVATSSPHLGWESGFEKTFPLATNGCSDAAILKPKSTPYVLRQKRDFKQPLPVAKSAPKKEQPLSTNSDPGATILKPKSTTPNKSHVRDVKDPLPETKAASYVSPEKTLEQTVPLTARTKSSPHFGRETNPEQVPPIATNTSFDSALSKNSKSTSFIGREVGNMDFYVSGGKI